MPSTGPDEHEFHTLTTRARTAASKAQPPTLRHIAGRRDALTDVSRYKAMFGSTIQEVTAQVGLHDKPNLASTTLAASKRAFDHFLDWLAIRQLEESGHGEPTKDQLSAITSDWQAQCSSGRFPDELSALFNDKLLVVAYLHIFAMTGQGKINAETVQHTNLRKRYDQEASSSRRQNAGLISDTGGAGGPSSSSSGLDKLDPRLRPSEAGPHSSVPLDPVGGYHLRSGRKGSLQLLEEESQRDPDSDSDDEDCWKPSIQGADEEAEEASDDFDDEASDEGAEEASNDLDDEASDEDDVDASTLDADDEAFDEDQVDISTLNAEDLAFADGIRSDPGATPVSYNTICARLSDILRHLRILKLEVGPTLRRDVIRIVAYLARKRRMYPTGQLTKLWISADTVAQVCSAVWNAAAHHAAGKGTRSVPTLLSLHTMILFLDEFGGRVGNYLDRQGRLPGEDGRFLRWGMITIKFCGYKGDGNPEFLLNIGTNSSKLSSRYADRDFHMETIGTGKYEKKSKDPIFSMVALALSQQVFEDDVSRIFTDMEFGMSLLRGTTSYVLSFKDEHVDAPVFIHGRCRSWHPETNVQINDRPYKHASDTPAHGPNHWPMSIDHLCDAFKLISRRLGLSRPVTTRMFRTTFAFQSQIKGKIPAWRLARRMGHFSGDKSLSRTVYAPTVGVQDTRRSMVGVDDSSAFSDNVRRAMSTNGALAHLVDPRAIDSALLDKARSLLEIFHTRLEENEASGQTVPDDELREMIDLFRRINGGVRVPFRDALAGLLSVTSVGAQSWSSLSEETHPFDNVEIRKGSDAVLLAWILRGATLQCPSCHDSYHEAMFGLRTLSNDAFEAYNACLQEKHEQFCCFVCAQLIPLADSTHAVQCFQKHFDDVSATCQDLKGLSVVQTGSFHLWKQSRYLICPVESCVDHDWHKRADANEKSYLHGIGTKFKLAARRQGPEIGGGKLSVYDEARTFGDHLTSHFFNPEIVGEGDDRGFQLTARLPTNLDETTIICPIRNCADNWNCDDEGRVAFHSHLVNTHKLPLFHQSDGSVVQSITRDNEHRLAHLLPYIAPSVQPMGTINVQHPDPGFDGFYVRENLECLRQLSNRGSGSVRHHSARISPEHKRKRRREYRASYRQSMTEEQHAAAKQTKRESERRRQASMTEEEKAAERAKKAQGARKRRAKRSDEERAAFALERNKKRREDYAQNSEAHNAKRRADSAKKRQAKTGVEASSSRQRVN